MLLESAPEQAGSPPKVNMMMKHIAAPIGGGEADVALVHRADPVEDLDRAGPGDGEGAEREESRSPAATWPDTNMWWPQTRKLIKADGDGGVGDEVIAEDVACGCGG
jgi:hypothetical protein